MLLLLYILYTVLVHNPLKKVLAERRGKTEGAIDKARADIAAAEARTSEYEQKLREARAVVLKRQDARRKEALDIRAKAVADARAHAQQQISDARAALTKDADTAKASLQAEAGRLATDIVRTVLRPAGAQ